MVVNFEQGVLVLGEALDMHDEHLGRLDPHRLTNRVAQNLFLAGAFVAEWATVLIGGREYINGAATSKHVDKIRAVCFQFLLGALDERYVWRSSPCKKVFQTRRL